MDSPLGPWIWPLVHGPTPWSMDPTNWSMDPTNWSMDPPLCPWTHPLVPLGPWTHRLVHAPMLIHGPTPRSMDAPLGPWTPPTRPSTRPPVHGPTPRSMDPPPGPWSQPQVHGPTHWSMDPPLGPWTRGSSKSSCKAGTTSPLGICQNISVMSASSGRTLAQTGLPRDPSKSRTPIVLGMPSVWNCRWTSLTMSCSDLVMRRAYEPRMWSLKDTMSRHLTMACTPRSTVFHFKMEKIEGAPKSGR